MIETLSNKVGRTILQDSASFFFYDFESCQTAFLERYREYVGEKSHRFFELESDVLSPNKALVNKVLGTDLIWLGPQDAKNVCVFISGTHGVEGYCGSAIQQFLLSMLQEGMLPHNTAILMIHSLNPWGMYWARRCDEAGIDLNRNFVDYHNTETPDPEYEGILNILINSHAPYQEMQKQSEKWGRSRFDTIFSGGQYQYQWAPFYGGNKPAHGRRVIEQVIADFKLAQRNTMVVDLHTGLGPWAFGELISDHFVNSYGNAQASAIFGSAIANAHSGDSFSVPKLGLLDYCFHNFMQQQGFFLTLEFGSYGSAALFDVLLRDHVFWKNFDSPRVDSSSYQLNREKMIEHFCPNDALWQQASLFKAWQVFSRLSLCLNK